MSRPFAEPEQAATPHDSSTASSTADPPSGVRRRHLFYLSGFDPKGPAHYHRLYGEQAALAGVVGGYRVEVGKRRRASEYSAAWTLRHYASAAAAEAAVETEVEFLRWDDIVRDHWPRNPAVLAGDLLRTTWLYLRSGALWKMFKLAWPPVVALFTPFLILLGLLAAVPVAIAAALATAQASGWLAGALAGIGLFAAAFGLAWLAERRMNMQWLLRSYAFTGRQGTQGWPALETRLDHFARMIAARARAAAAGGTAACDELLIVAHSSGSIMATSALARALALDPQLARHGPRISLLTMGQWSPLLSSLPSAQRFRDELARLAAEPKLDWVDFTAPPDGCCFALTDPIAAAGLPLPRADHPRLLSPRFAALFSPASYAAIKRDRFRLHFQYLMASELPGAYDYTAITSGPLTLGRRFAAQPSVTDFTQFRLFG